MSTGNGLVPPPPAIRPSASAQAIPKPKLQRIHMGASYRGKSVQIDLDPISQEVYTWQALKSKVYMAEGKYYDKIATKYILWFNVICAVCIVCSCIIIILFYDCIMVM